MAIQATMVYLAARGFYMREQWDINVQKEFKVRFQRATQTARLASDQTNNKKLLGVLHKGC